MPRTNNKYKDGMTLVEIIIAMAIFSTLMVMAFSVIISANKITTRLGLIRDTQSEAKNVIEYIRTKMESPNFCSFDLTNEDQTLTITLAQTVESCDDQAANKPVYQFENKNTTLEVSDPILKPDLARAIHPSTLKVKNWEMFSDHLTGPPTGQSESNPKNYLRIKATFEDDKGVFKYHINTGIFAKKAG